MLGLTHLLTHYDAVGIASLKEKVRRKFGRTFYFQGWHEGEEKGEGERERERFLEWGWGGGSWGRRHRDEDSLGKGGSGWGGGSVLRSGFTGWTTEYCTIIL